MAEGGECRGEESEIYPISPPRKTGQFRSFPVTSMAEGGECRGEEGEISPRGFKVAQGISRRDLSRRGQFRTFPDIYGSRGREISPHADKPRHEKNHS